MPSPIAVHGPEAPDAPLDRAGPTEARAGALLVHGFTGTPFELRPLADALSAAGYPVRAPLLPGHGSTPAMLARETHARWRDAARAQLEGALARWPRVLVVAMSLGSLLALELLEDPALAARVAGLVTLGCPLQLNRPSTVVLRLARALGPVMPDVHLAKKHGSDVRDDAVRAYNPGYRVNPLRAARELTRAQDAARRALARVHTPLLAVHGALDRTAPVASSLELLAGVRSRDASLFLAPRSGHLVGVDLDRDAVREQVRAFAARVAPA